jgi:dipeptidyl aminopeptidase/acylaminoacyl peptidase
MSIIRTAFLSALAVTAALAAPLPAVAAPTDPIPAAAFFDNARMSDAQISPDGKHVAILFNNSKSKWRDELGVIDLADRSLKIVATFADIDIGNVEWVNNRRLAFDLHDKVSAPRKVEIWPGLYGVNVDGSELYQLVSHGASKAWVPGAVKRKMLPYNYFLLHQTGSQDSDTVWVVRTRGGHNEETRLDLLKLDTITNKIDEVSGPSGPIQAWMLDGQGHPALATTVDDTQEILHYLDPKTGAWRKLATGGRYLSKEGSITPLGFTPDGQLFVTSRQGRNTIAPFRYDLATGKLASQPLVDMPDFDFGGSLVVDSGKLLGIRYVADGEGTTWFDPAMKGMQEAVDKLLPGRVNSLRIGRRAETPFVLVVSWSDRQPAQFLVFNRETGRLAKLGDSRPDIDAARMAGLDLVRIKARDGMTIPTWVTVPNGGSGKKLPMVMLVHGGPNVRGSTWQWDAERQFLASRGYVVVEPEFRGSVGYGQALYRAGWKQWGLAMQDDIADATRWAVEQGIADPKRICIAGASYGGYATLMGLIRDPSLYKCGIDWVGVTDIDLLYGTRWWEDDNDVPEGWKRNNMPTVIGDRQKDAAQFAATSPLKLAARITQPLLLAYGGIDQRVPIYHGRRFMSAVKETNKQVEWVEYEEEGHGWKLLQTKLDFWGRVEKFLQQQIGAPAP